MATKLMGRVEVHRLGYVWKGTKLEPVGDEVFTYDPLDRKGLFLELFQDRTREYIRDFCNRYGCPVKTVTSTPARSR